MTPDTALQVGPGVKIYRDPIQVKIESPAPFFEWRGCVYRIRAIIDRWVIQGKWWAREEKRCFFLVQASCEESEGYYEICLSSAQGWVLVGVYD